MQAPTVTTASSAAISGGNAGLQAQIAALRESLKNQRDRSRQLWETCAPGAGVEDNRASLGRFTEKLVKGPLDEAYG